MAATTIERILPAEYLEAERKSDTKHEYIDGILLPMPGASWIHTLICTNLIRLIGNFLEKKDLTVHSNDLRVANVGGDKYFYPDIVVIQGEPNFTDNIFDTITNPFLIVEVLSESTESYDRGDKFQAYRSLTSLQEYVLVSQDKPLIEVFSRHQDGWRLTEASGLDSIIRLQKMNLDLSLEAVYAKVKFSNL
jgi:Uma2 family endonuclease